MNLTMLPEIIMESSFLHDDKEQLLELRHSLQLACQDVEDRLRALEGFEFEENLAMGSMERITAEHEKEGLLNGAPMETRMVMEASSPSVMSADLEQATLEELNAALAKAFAQMASRIVW
jgi:hypothetical protein